MWAMQKKKKKKKKDVPFLTTDGEFLDVAVMSWKWLFNIAEMHLIILWCFDVLEYILSTVY